VLFEMLAGMPPAALTPPEGPAAGPLRPRNRLEELVALRPSLPPEVAGLVARMLEPKPRDRFATGAEAAEALAAPSGIWTPRSVLARRRRRWAGAGSLAAIGVISSLLIPRIGASYDATLYTIVPFEHRGATVPAQLDGDKCELLLHRAFGRWQDVRVVDEQLVNDYRAQRGFATLTLNDALDLARHQHSRWLVWGSVWEFRDSSVVGAALYDAGRRRSDREYTVRLAQDLSDVDEKFSMLADSLLLGVGRVPESATGAMGTHKRQAWQAFADGQAALARWNLESAERAFGQALAIDPAFASAALWLAQVQEWAGRPPDVWQRAAVAAEAGKGTLTPRERTLVQGLLALGDQRYPEACDTYEEIVKRDTTDYVGWFGLGECRFRDSLVVRDAGSPSTWGFRASFHAAAEAYAHALRLVPSSHIAFGDTAFGRLSRLLFTETNVYRPGFASAPDTMRFGAFPALVGDTLAFIPYPLDEGLSLRRFPPSNGEAVRRNRVLLQRVTDAWLQAFPASPAVLETHALVLETMGEVAAVGSPRRSALDAVRAARRLAQDSTQALRLAVAEARLLLKLGDFAGTRAIIDSALTAARNPPSDLAALLAGPALLVGHVHRAAAYARAGFNDSLMDFTVREGPAVMGPAWELLVYASAGRPRDSILALERRVDGRIESYVPPDRRPLTRAATMDMAATEAFPEIGITDRHRAQAGRNYLLRVQLEAGRGASAAAKGELDSMWAARRQWQGANLSIDGTFLEAALYTRMADTANAIRVLDASLEAPLNLDTYTLAWLTLPADLVRAMVLRARLAAATADRQTAARWAAAVVALRSGADPEFQPVVDSMRTLAGVRGPR
jgi:tetratricopeptide (TPR) repeat protein